MEDQSQTQTEEKQASRKLEHQTRLILLIFLILLVTIGLVIFFAQRTKTKNTSMYNDEFEITEINDAGFIHYKLKLFVNDNPQPFLIDLRYNPKDIETIPVDDGVREQVLNSSQIYVTITPNTNLSSTTAMAAFEIESIMDNPYLYGIPVSSAFTTPYKNSTIKTCLDASEKVSVIWFKLGEETKVSLQDKCIIVTGVTEDDLIKAAEKLVLKILEVIKV